MGEQLHIDGTDRNLELMQPDGRAAAGIDQEFLLASLNQRAGAETIRARDRPPSLGLDTLLLRTE